MEWLLFATALFIAFSNGANDNFKGFATVWGSDTLSYRRALTLATIATVLGSLVSLLLADGLVAQFSGKGLVPDALANTPAFILSVTFGAALTVFLATRLGLPISTTHALIGGLLGAGLGQSQALVNFDKLLNSFLLPLLLSPLLAGVIGVFSYQLLQVIRGTARLALASGNSQGMADVDITPSAATSGRRVDSPWLAQVHVASAMAICFARGVNDTPKLAALMIAAQLCSASQSITLIAASMALGGWLFAHKVATTMSQKVTRMDQSQGVRANLITAALVLFASKLGVPVSTTHVAIGSIAGVGASARTLNWPTLRNVLLSWVATLPLAALLAWFMAHFF
jgi:PiT family inorganic phosphate transporter